MTDSIVITLEVAAHPGKSIRKVLHVGFPVDAPLETLRMILERAHVNLIDDTNNMDWGVQTVSVHREPHFDFSESLEVPVGSGT